METIKDFCSNSFAGCTMSEKFDGIQGVWDGHSLKTRTGNEIFAPEWWVKTLPNRTLVGELWVKRGGFGLVQSIVLRKTPDDRWNKVRFKVFNRGDIDLGRFAESVEQIKIESQRHFESFYHEIIENGGEGIVLTDRKGNQFKRKPVQDDDGELIDFTEGRGRNADRVGAFILKLRDGREWKVGSLTFGS